MGVIAFIMSVVASGFKNEEGEWSKEALALWSDKNEESIKSWADGQRAEYKNPDSEKGKTLREKHAKEEDLEQMITDMRKKKLTRLWEFVLQNRTYISRCRLGMKQ